MINWKKNIKKIFVFLLILGFIGSTVNHSLFTVTAAEANTEEGSPEAEDDTPGNITADNPIHPECTCKLPCTDELTDADCPVCKDDPTACCGKASQTQPDENTDADTNESGELPEGLESAADTSGKRTAGAFKGCTPACRDRRADQERMGCHDRGHDQLGCRDRSIRLQPYRRRYETHLAGRRAG